MNEDDISVAETPHKSDDGGLKPASRPVASNDEGLKQTAFNDRGDLAAATYAPVKDGPTVENNLTSKCLFTIDPAGPANTISPTNK